MDRGSKRQRGYCPESGCLRVSSVSPVQEQIQNRKKEWKKSRKKLKFVKILQFLSGKKKESGFDDDDGRLLVCVCLVVVVQYY